MTAPSCYNWGPSSVNQYSCLNKLRVTVLKKTHPSVDPFINLLFKTISCKGMYCLPKYTFLSQTFVGINGCTVLIMISVCLCMHFRILSKSWSLQTGILGRLFTAKLLKPFQSISWKCAKEKSDTFSYYIVSCLVFSSSICSNVLSFLIRRQHWRHI